eukprot:6182449-Pleurochrysis_carterae.AAC.2
MSVHVARSNHCYSESWVWQSALATSLASSPLFVLAASTMDAPSPSCLSARDHTRVSLRECGWCSSRAAAVCHKSPTVNPGVDSLLRVKKLQRSKLPAPPPLPSFAPFLPLAISSARASPTVCRARLCRDELDDPSEQRLVRGAPHERVEEHVAHVVVAARLPRHHPHPRAVAVAPLRPPAPAAVCGRRERSARDADATRSGALGLHKERVLHALFTRSPLLACGTRVVANVYDRLAGRADGAGDGARSKHVR